MMTPIEKMVQAKAQFYDASHAWLLHLNDAEPLWEYEGHLHAATETYWEALFYLREELREPTGNPSFDYNPRYRKAIEDLLDQLRSHVLFLTQVIQEYRSRQGLDT